MENIILHDCSGTKLQALEGVCTHLFGINEFKLVYIKHYDDGSDSLLSTSFVEMTNSVSNRFKKLQNLFEGHKSSYNKEATIFYATMEKHFIETMDHRWMFVGHALFGTKELSYPGMTEAIPIKQELWPSMYLPKNQRCKKVTEDYRLPDKGDLVQKMISVSESDWLKPAFRNPVKMFL